MTEEQESNIEPDDDISLDEIQTGIFNLVIGMHMAYAETMPEDQARLVTASYLKSLIDGLLLNKEQQEESNT